MPGRLEHPDLRAVKEAAEAAVSAGKITQAYVDFRISILDATASAGECIDPPGSAFDPEIAEKCLRSGVPLLACDGPIAPPAGLPALARDVAAMVASAGVEGGAKLLLCLDSEGGPDAALEAARALLARDGPAFESAAEKAGAPAQLLKFVLSAALYPFLAPAAAKLFSALRQDLWMRGWCPVCGLEPVAAKFVREPPGARIMRCSGCAYEWRATRVSCPFCGNTDSETLKVLSGDFSAAERIYACDRCRRHLKEIDERKTIEGTSVNLAAFDVVSLHLDLIAEAEGYG